MKKNYNFRTASLVAAALLLFAFVLDVATNRHVRLGEIVFAVSVTAVLFGGLAIVWLSVRHDRR